jgi:4-hydroxy-tetrahydrodipicolinate synthase
MKIIGSIVAIVTPMQTDGSIDFNSLEALVEQHIDAGTQGIVVLGTTGESPTIETEERSDIIRCVIEKAAGRIPIIVGTGTNSTVSTLRLTLEAKQLGADACLLVTPYYNKPTQEGLYQHFATIAQDIDIHQILYNVPKRTGCDLLPETVCRLAEHPNIIGIKESTGDLKRLAELKSQCSRADFLYYSGEDAITKDFINQGGHGVISVTANIAPAWVSELCQAALANDQALAQSLHERLLPLYQQLFVESNPIPVKWAMHHMGKIPAGIRPPLMALSAAYHAPLTKAIFGLNHA